MTTKVHGFVQSPDQFMAAAMDVYNLAVANYDLTVADVTPTVDGVAQPGYNAGLQAVINALGMRCMPVVVGAVSATGFHFIADKAQVFEDVNGDGLYTDINAYVTAALKAAVPSATTATVTLTKIAL